MPISYSHSQGYGYGLKMFSILSIFGNNHFQIPLVRFQCFDNAIAKKYTRILHQHVDKGMHIDNIESFGKYRSDKQTQDMLLKSIDNINIFFKRKVIDLKVDSF